MNPVRNWSDDEIKKGIIDNLYWDARVRVADVEVTVKSGDVTLHGTVPSFHEWSIVTDRVREMPGVLSVADEMTIRSPDEGSTPIDDERIQSNIENALSWNPSIEAKDIHVHVDGGSVTLEGTVDSAWKKQHVAGVVATVGGVLGVQNNLGVAPLNRESDKVIAERIAHSLAEQLPADSRSIDVTVLGGGVALLRGAVWHPSLRRLARDIAMRTVGVSAVQDELVVKVDDSAIPASP